MKKLLAIIFAVISSFQFSFSQTDPDDEKVFLDVEKMPLFPGGEAAMLQFIRTNIRYPYKARENGVEGTVYISFVIDTNGNVSRTKLLRGVSAELDEEALRVVNSMPVWAAGIQNNKKVNVQYNIPIKFTIAIGNPGIDLFKSGHYAEAIELFTSSINKNDRDKDAYHNRAACYMKLGNDSAACSDWQKAVELGDKESESLIAKYCGVNHDSVVVQNDPDADKIFTVVEVMPKFPGGEAALLKYITTNLNYPKEARKNHIEGDVYVTFIVDNSGKVQDAKILRGIGSGCDEEALRLINSLPDWSPGTQNGRPVSVQYNFPVRF